MASRVKKKASKSKVKVAKKAKKASAKALKATKVGGKKSTVKKKKSDQKKAPKKALKKTASKSKAKTKVKSKPVIKASRNLKSGKSKKAVQKSITEKVEALTQDSQSQSEYFKNPPKEVFSVFRTISKNRKTLADKVEKTSGKKKAFLAKPIKNGKSYRLDLRIHSPLTQGYFNTGGIDPASAFVLLSKAKGLDLVAVTDFYTADFIDDVREIAEAKKMTVLPGVDLCCIHGNCNEVFITALFPEDCSSQKIQEVLTELKVPAWAKGRPDYCVEVDLKKTITTIEKHGGVVIPSHLDKTPHRQLAIASLVKDFGIHAFDLVCEESQQYFQSKWPEGEFTFFSFSNANALAQIGTRSVKVKLSKPGFAGIKELVQRRI